jgi:GGDEF domain-containing protein
LGASIGIAVYPKHAKAADQLLIAADGAMYMAKRAGGNRHYVATKPQ